MVNPAPLADFQIVKQKLASHTTSSTNPYEVIKEIIEEQLDQLAVHDEVAAQIIRLRFMEENKLYTVGNKLSLSEHTISRRQRKAIRRLSELILEEELALRQDRIGRLKLRLPPKSYSQLFGLKETRLFLGKKLLQPAGPWVLTLTGIGGIGKTALADILARDAIEALHFDDIVWVRVNLRDVRHRHHSLEPSFDPVIDAMMRILAPHVDVFSRKDKLFHLRQILNSRPCLVVIDNLEVEAETSYIASQLMQLTHPSKFLLTTRTHLDPTIAAFHFEVDALSQTDAAALLNNYAKERNVAAWARAGEAEIEAIYALVGGNPLALKLIVSLLDWMNLGDLLKGLEEGQSGHIEDMYSHIYRYAWETLSDPAKTLLLAMPLIGESGGTLDYLREISQLNADHFWPAVGELRTRSLLEVRGDLKEKRYGIHRLTSTFIHQEILKREMYE